MIKGIDVSSFQSQTYSLTGVDFVFVKATEGTTYTNPKHAGQVKRARDNGRVVGHYHFLHPGNVQAQAEYFVRQAAPKAGDVLACDWEATSSGNAGCAEKDAFMKAVKKLRPDHQVILYCSTDWWLHHDTTSYRGDGLWIAHYGVGAGHPGIKDSWLIHQYTSDPLDTNTAAFDSRAAMAAWAAGEEDPMAGMTPQQIHDAVWKIDDIAGPADAPDHKTNPTWQPQSILKDIQAQVRALKATEAAQTAAITKLASLVGTGVDTAEVVAEVKKAIADAVVKVNVDVTGQDS